MLLLPQSVWAERLEVEGEPRFRELAEQLIESVEVAAAMAARSDLGEPVALERTLEFLRWHDGEATAWHEATPSLLPENEAAALRVAIAWDRGEPAPEACDGPDAPGLGDALRYFCSRFGLRSADVAMRGRAARMLAEMAGALEGPADAVGYDAYWSGRAALVLGDPGLARMRLEEALAERPASMRVALALAEALLRLDEAPRAGALLSALMEEAPWHPQVWVQTAELNRRIGAADALVAVALAAAEVLRPGMDEVRVVRAAHALDQGNPRGALGHLDGIRTGPFRSAETMALALAAQVLVEGEWPEALWPLPAEVAAAGVLEAGRVLERSYRYPDVLALYRRGLELGVEDARLYGRLAVAWSRQGDDAQALHYARRALELEPEREEARMLVRLHEVDLGAYLYLEDPEMEGLRYRFHEEEIAMLRHVVPAATRETLRRYAAWYGRPPPLPLTVEVIREPELFGVRTVGRADISPHGICFGPVVVLRSPRPGDFNWRHVLEHELSHTFTLALSGYRVPRWLTEGLAELDTRRLRPDTRRRADFPVSRALGAGRLPALEHLDRAFLRPTTAGIAYQMAFLFSEWLEERSGRGAIVALLEALGRGADLEEAFGEALGLRTSVVERLFDAWLRNHLASLVALYEPDPEAWRERRRGAGALSGGAALEDGEGALALWFGGDRRASAAAAEVLRDAPLDPAARYVQVSAAIEAGELEEALEGLARFREAGYSAFTLHARLGRVARERGELELALEQLRAAAELLDSHGPVWRTLAEVEEELGVDARDSWARSAALEWGDAHARVRLLEGTRHAPERYRLLEELMEIRPLDQATLLRWVEEALAVGECARIAPLAEPGLEALRGEEAGEYVLRAAWQRSIAESWEAACGAAVDPR